MPSFRIREEAFGIKVRLTILDTWHEVKISRVVKSNDNKPSLFNKRLKKKGYCVDCDEF